MKKKPETWETLDRRTILSHNKFLSVENHTIKLHDGRVIPDWPWIITPDFVNMIAVTVDGRIVCFRQTKYAVTGTSLGPPGGFIEKDESPLAAAKRELREETGYEAQEWESLGTYRVDPNRGAGTAHLFLARNAEYVAEPVEDDLEEQRLVLLTPEEVRQAIHNGEVKVLPWAAALSLALDRISPR